MPYFNFRYSEVRQAITAMEKAAQDFEQVRDDKGAELARQILALLQRLEPMVAKHVKS